MQNKFVMKEIEMSRIIKISNCGKCPHLDHRGAFSTPSHIPKCRLNSKLDLPYTVDTHGQAIGTGVIPEGCPLPKESLKTDEEFVQTLLLLDASYDADMVRELLKKANGTSQFYRELSDWESDLLDKYNLWKGKIPYQLTDADKAFIKEHGDTHGTATEAELIQTIKAIHDNTEGQINHIVDAYLLWGKALSYGKS